MAKFKVGDIVEDDFLGLGTVVEIYPNYNFLVRVLFNETPDSRYNMGENPTVALTYKLKKLRTQNDRA
jgi:hypothetical protein